MTGRHDDLDRALRLADLADQVTVAHYRSRDLRVTTKPDATPVTQADLEVEQSLSAVVTAEFGDGYLGEEGTTAADSRRVWVVDPVDGTKNYLRGMPVWATLIALVEDGAPVVAVVSAPALGRRWWAVAGRGAWTRDCDGAQRPISVSSVSAVADAFVCYGSLFSWERTMTGLRPVIDLLRAAWRHRSVGDFFGHMLVAEGAADGCFEPDLRYWDFAAVSLIVTEAGGRAWSSVAGSGDPAEPRISITATAGLLAPLRAALAAGPAGRPAQPRPS